MHTVPEEEPVHFPEPVSGSSPPPLTLVSGYQTLILWFCQEISHLGAHPTHRHIVINRTNKYQSPQRQWL